VVHDLLAFPVEQMLEMNKQKLQEIKGFLHWLEREMGAKVHDLSPKTKVQEYYKLKFDERWPSIRPGGSQRRRSGRSLMHLWASCCR
jgi:hypothetical protein